MVYVIAGNKRQFEDYCFERKLRTRPLPGGVPPEAVFVANPTALARANGRDRIDVTGTAWERRDMHEIIGYLRALGRLDDLGID